MDSIYKGFPYGTVLMWRSTEVLDAERELGGFFLPAPTKDYPIDYVLDGQQRITAIFRTFQTEVPVPPEDPESWLPIYYDFRAMEDAQESRFVALQSADYDEDRYFPLSSFFDPVGFAEKYTILDDAKKKEIVAVQDRFKGALIPEQTFETGERSEVAIVFERVNRMGIELDIFQLLTAWTWSEDFDLQDRFLKLGEVLEEVDFKGIGEDSDLMMRCCAAILRSDPSPSALIDINGSEMRDDFERIEKALKLAVDFLKTNLNVTNVKFLPYPTLLVALASYFSVDQAKSMPNDDRVAIVRWFWRSSFGHRYSGNPLRNIRADVSQAIKLRRGEENTLGDFSVVVGVDDYLDRKFNLNTVATRTFVLQLAQHRPKTFLSGSPIELKKVLSEPNRHEFHHCYPRAYLANGIEADTNRISDLVNFSFLSRSDNRTISKKAPSEYVKLMAKNVSAIADSQLLPHDMFDDDWQKFRKERAVLLSEDAGKLIGE